MKAFFQRYTWGIIPLLLCLIGVSGYYVVLFRGKAASQAQEKERLVTQLREANEAQKSAIITRRVSSQLEEIAYQQKDISDAQKQEAENQKLIAEQMRDHAELEREKAIAAQQAALEAYEEMDAQKRIAEQRRAEAEGAQMRADSLARLALARSLAVQATKQYEVGNKPLAALLSYSAWKFTAENQGDLYLPALYKALSLSSELSHQWRVHRGAIRSLLSYSLGGNAYLLTTSQYGEIYRWKLSAGQLMDRQTLFNDPKYDIRSLRVDTLHRRLFAMAYGGQLLIISAANKVEIQELPISQPVGMEYWQEQVVIAQKNGVLCVGEVSNMGCTPEAIDTFIENKIMYGPGKAVNAGGVATSGLEMSQNAMHLSWSEAEVDEKLHGIMNDIHTQCVKYGTEEDGYINYMKGANIAGFMKVANAMMAQGII